ncbi:hypothetical protein [Stenotrophomonas sp. STK17_22]|uniref:hypothetical protein n=1 Tax=Stenotrophomonas sp. STK17_22 TaxID=3455201 RepID=UPI003F81FF3A
MQESTKLPSVGAVTAAVIAAFHAWHERWGTPHDLVQSLSSVIGHAANFDLDQAEGDCAGLSIYQIDIHRGIESHYVGVLYGESVLSIFLYGPRTFTLSTGRAESADDDSGEMLTFDPHSMDELDALGMFSQVPKCRPRQLAMVDLGF